MPEQPNEDIVRKIQKMLSLATGGNNSEQEAAAAMAMAQKMLARYNLDYHTVQAAQVAGGTNVVEEKREKNQMEYGAMYQWQRDLWACIAEVNFCWHWVGSVYGPSRHKASLMVRSKKHMVLGRQTNVLSVRLMGEYLCDTLERVLPYPNRERLSRSALSWRSGAADRLMERLREQYRQSQNQPAADGPTTALTLVDVAKREEAANYDARWGVGSWAAKLADDAEWEAGKEERAAEAAKRRADEEREWLEYLQKETPDQKKQRERLEEKEYIKAARQRGRERQRWANEQYREARKTDHSAYAAGVRTAENISLNRQVESGAKQQALGTEKAGR